MQLKPPLLNREESINRLSNDITWDIIIIGGGATGLGLAVDAASRGFATLLLEQSDFAKGTSSRSTKLVHGGVRYLAQGNFRLVYEALHERGLLLKNAPHLVKKQSFIVPCYDRVDQFKYLAGLKFYDLMSGRLSFGASHYLNREKTKSALPGITDRNLKGSIEYFDGQFDDARLAIDLAKTATEHGAVLLNYCEVIALQKSNSKISGLTAHDLENEKTYNLKAKVVINATGVFVDDIMKMDQPSAKEMIRPSQGVHLVVKKEFLKTDHALMIPQTSDGRVLFAVPWQQHVLLGTTDTSIEKASSEPVALEQEIEFILNTVKDYFVQPPTADDVLSVFAGLRPLAASSKDVKTTKELSRDHKLMISESGLFTITGGKWTTYRKMAEHTIDEVIKLKLLKISSCKTKELKIHGSEHKVENSHLSIYGSDAVAIEALIKTDSSLAKKISPSFEHTEAEVIWAIRNEMARTVEDILARRLRILFLNAQAAIDAAPRVAEILEIELKKDAAWGEQKVNDFISVARNYLISTR
ncbi:MAG: glycerol-3-phosphate dehydrogenase/oxidase [Flavisolibacter sp.]